MPRVLIGGVGYRFQRDASFGLAASDALERLDWPAGVDVQDLGYGAIYAAQDIGAAEPPYDRVILLAGSVRGREAGTLQRRAWTPLPVSDDELQARIREAGAGVIDLDHLLIVATHFRALPADVILYELEPVDADGGEGLSDTARQRLDETLRRVREEVLALFAASSLQRMAT